MKEKKINYENKMAINAYLSTAGSKKQTKQTRTETESWILSVLMVARQERSVGEYMKM